MKFGMICPIAHLDLFATGEYHLLLSHLLVDQRYRDHYRVQADENAWITLDNSAFEHGQSVSVEQLLHQAVDINASEFVLPDVMYDASGTLEASSRALDILTAHERELGNMQMMLVAHGTSIFTWGSCLSRLVELYRSVFPKRPFSIGVPKNYDGWHGGSANLISRFILSLRAEYDCDVHLLGVGRDISQTVTICVRYPWIRSTDSTKPFVYAYHGLSVGTQQGGFPEYPGRPDDFFSAVFDDAQLKLAKHNAAVYQRKVTVREQDTED